MNPPNPEVIPGYARRHEDWHEVTAISSLGRRTLSPISNYVLVRAATRADATPAARLLLVHLIGYLGQDDPGRPESRFVVFPGNQRLSDELRCTPRSIQRQADELEEKGLLRRCYNGMNRRTGFDLTPFAVQHAEIVAGIIALQTQRRQSREASQLELSLTADRIERPDPSASSATQTSPRDDAGVAHNRPEPKNNDVVADAGAALDAIDRRAFAEVIASDSGSEDRTGFDDDRLLALVTQRFTGGGRSSHLGWSAALRTMGRDRAVALYLVAERDPRRRATTERYFGWLLRMFAEGAGDVVVEAAARAVAAGPGAPREQRRPKPSTDVVRPDRSTDAVAPRRVKPASPPSDQASLPTIDDHRGDNVPLDPIRAAAHAILGERLYRSWIEPTEFVRDGNVVTVVAGTGFAAEWLGNHMQQTLSKAVKAALGGDAQLHIATRAEVAARGKAWS
jgi:hypothetical protein